MSDTPRKTSEILRVIIQASPLAIITLDTNDRVTTWNPAAERVFGWSEAEVLRRRPPCVPDDKQEDFEQNHIEKTFFSCIISSVVTSHTLVFRDTVANLSDNKDNNILVLNHKMDTGLKLKVKAPEELGTDRLASAVGAYELYQAPVAVIDFGTATSITVVGINGDLIGGAIMPGVGLMNDMLVQRTSKLKKVPLEQPGAALGTDTAECIRSGLLIGTAGAAERILDEIERETGYEFRLVITGGYAHFMDPLVKRPHELNLFLTHEGLKRIFAANRHASTEDKRF